MHEVEGAILVDLRNAFLMKVRFKLGDAIPVQAGPSQNHHGYEARVWQFLLCLPPLFPGPPESSGPR